jgi:hypothetical protein
MLVVYGPEVAVKAAIERGKGGSTRAELNFVDAGAPAAVRPSFPVAGGDPHGYLPPGLRPGSRIPRPLPPSLRSRLEPSIPPRLETRPPASSRLSAGDEERTLGVDSGARPAGTPEHREVVRSTAVQITAEFAANEADATRRYRQRPVEITGKVVRVDPDAGRMLSVVLAGDTDQSFVTCVQFVSAKSVVPYLRVGKTITVRSKTVQYLRSPRSVMLSDCTLEKTN